MLFRSPFLVSQCILHWRCMCTQAHTRVLVCGCTCGGQKSTLHHVFLRQDCLPNLELPCHCTRLAVLQVPGVACPTPGQCVTIAWILICILESWSRLWLFILVEQALCPLCLLPRPHNPLLSIVTRIYHICTCFASSVHFHVVPRHGWNMVLYGQLRVVRQLPDVPHKEKIKWKTERLWIESHPL